VTGAHNVSNRFYSVHARRNDRFLRASSVFRAVFPEVDLADVCFTRHLLQKIQAEAPERFHILREELQVAWLARMRSFLLAVGPPALLLWLSPHLPSDAPWEERADPLARDPLFVTRRMIDQLRPLVRGVVMVQPNPPHGARPCTTRRPAPWPPASGRPSPERQAVLSVRPSRSAPARA
jgi:hypothetical protein